MNFFTTLCASLVCASLGVQGQYSLFNSVTYPISNHLFPEKSSETINSLEEALNEIENEDTNSLYYFPKTPFNSIPTNIIGSARNATGSLIYHIGYITTNVASAIAETAANTGVDVFLAQYKLVAGLTGYGSNFTLPDIESSGYIYDITATGGYFSSLSSLEKNGRINVTIKDTSTVIIDIPLRFTELHVRYEKISATAFYFLTLSGSFSIDVKNNSISIKLRLGIDSTCAISVEEIKITDLGDITVKLEGFNSYLSYFIGSITGSVSNFLISYMKTVITGQIQNAVDKIVKQTLSSNSTICSSFIPVQYTFG